MKIAYVLPSLEKNGGAERIITDKANYFTERFAYDVYIITLFQHHDASNFYPLSHQVHQINLEIPYHRQYHYRYPRRLWEKININRRMRQALYHTIYTKNDRSYWHELDREMKVFTAKENMPYLRDDDTKRAPFGKPPVVVNYFFHEEVKKSAK
jgi:hypothetical protein